MTPPENKGTERRKPIACEWCCKIGSPPRSEIVVHRRVFVVCDDCRRWLESQVQDGQSS